MKCDQCDQEATVHETRRVHGKTTERHLCQDCARKIGIDIQPTVASPELFEKLLQAAAGKPAAPATSPTTAKSPARKACSCGTTYVEFRKTGLLGCEKCYTTFEAQLGPLLERAHEGGITHIGKLPRRALAGSTPRPVLGDAAQRAARIAALRKQLEEAVCAEQYERAASLRDELRKLTDLQHPSSPSGPSA